MTADVIFSSYVNGTTFQLALKNSEVAFNVPKSFVDIQYFFCRIIQRSFDETAASLRKKLALREGLGSYFQNKEIITTEEKKSKN